MTASDIGEATDVAVSRSDCELNVYETPLVSPSMMHEPAAVLTVHVLPPGDAVTR